MIKASAAIATKAQISFRSTRTTSCRDHLLMIRANRPLRPISASARLISRTRASLPFGTGIPAILTANGRESAWMPEMSFSLSA